MSADQDSNAPAGSHGGSPTDTPEPCSDGLESVIQPDLRTATGALPSMSAHLERLRSAFPAFSFSIRPGWRGLAFEAWCDPVTAGLYAVITNDARELWRELEQCPAGRDSATLVTPATRNLR